ncbi:collagen-like protein, partial [Salmonella enterica]|nr:collagen-like protein [Salmonella enterica]
MKKISDITPTADENGEFTDGQVTPYVSPTELLAAWFNTIQRELCNILSAAGIPVTPEDDAQIAKAIKQLARQYGNGLPGDKGDTGPRGPKGDKGDKGDIGPQGGQGPAGPKGNTGDIGPAGPEGETGADGRSAYDIWVSQQPGGADTTLSAYMQSMEGKKGPQGIQGPQGLKGEPGQSAYEIWVSQQPAGSDTSMAVYLKYQKGTGNKFLGELANTPTRLNTDIDYTIDGTWLISGGILDGPVANQSGEATVQVLHGDSGDILQVFTSLTATSWRKITAGTSPSLVGWEGDSTVGDPARFNPGDYRILFALTEGLSEGQEVESSQITPVSGGSVYFTGTCVIKSIIPE